MSRPRFRGDPHVRAEFLPAAQVWRPLKPLIYQRRRPYDNRTLTDLTRDRVFNTDAFEFGVDGRCNVGLEFWQQAFGSEAVLDETNFDLAYDATLKFKSDEGRPLGIKPNVLAVGPTNSKAALDLIMKERKANGEDNINKGIVEILVPPWLT